MPSYFFICAAVLLAVAVCAALTWEVLRLRRVVAHLSSRESDLLRDADHDPLTGLFNRSYVQRRLGAEASFEGVVAVLDLDDLKGVNDRFGHFAGDEVIAAVGRLLQNSVRQNDVACRWGGDEFLLLFQNTDSTSARERLRHIESRLLRFRLRAFGALPLRVSWGVMASGGMLLSEAIAAADREMYQMKRGRKASGIQLPGLDAIESKSRSRAASGD